MESYEKLLDFLEFEIKNFLEELSVEGTTEEKILEVKNKYKELYGKVFLNEVTDYIMFNLGGTNIDPEELK